MLRPLSLIILFSFLAVACNESNSSEKSEEVIDEPISAIDNVEDSNWLDFEFDSVKAYCFDNYNRNEMQGIIVDRGINPTVFNPDGTLLNDSQVSRLEKIMNGAFEPSEYEMSECFIPRHGFVFFDSSEIAANISICFECNGIKSNPASLIGDTRAFQRLFKDLEIPIKKEDFPVRDEE